MPSGARHCRRWQPCSDRGATRATPLYGIRRTLQVGAQHFTDKQSARLDAKLILGDPEHEVTLAWQCYQKLRNIYPARPEKCRQLVTEVVASFRPCLIPAASRLGPTLEQWKAAILANFGTFSASNGPTEASNGVKPPADSPEASATSPTTDSDAHSPPPATVPTGSNRPTMHNVKSPISFEQ